jgi:hypothetical protein
MGKMAKTSENIPRTIENKTGNARAVSTKGALLFNLHEGDWKPLVDRPRLE